MQRIEIKLGNRLSLVSVGESIKNLSPYINLDNTVILTDENLDRHYSDYFPPCRKIVISTGEAVKNLSTVEEIGLQLLKLGADRKTFLLGIGGGLLCDIAGFTASIFMRGIDFGFVSTSLLSQVDASVGGKNGVNLRGLKNMLGLFNQPEFVICDHEMLSTLPEYEYINGIAELVKTACLENRGLMEYISENKEKILARDNTAVHESVYRCVRYKASVVEEDERESGKRMFLNLGHTLGHAIEKVTGMGHGYAISAGMGFAFDLSSAMGLMSSEEGEKIKSLLKYFGLPSEIKGIISDENMGDVLEALAGDKKKEGASVNFVLLESAGNPLITKISHSEVEKHIRKNLMSGGKK